MKTILNIDVEELKKSMLQRRLGKKTRKVQGDISIKEIHATASSYEGSF